MPNGYVSQIQINGGDVQNIGSCAYAVCDTAEDVSVKVVTLPGFVLKDGATIHVKFMYRNIAFNPKLNVNGTGGKTILLNTNSGFDSSLNLSSQYNVDQLWMAGAVVTLTYDGTYWVVNNPSRITSPYTYNLSAGNTIEPGSYMILADIEWELCTGASSATARVFPFKVCMSTMVDGVYRDRSAIMEVFVGGGYNKKDYVDIMIHDESEYHVNNDYVFDSLVDSIFIYFEYEVSSGNVIGKRTGHLLGKVPSRWSSFQLVPLTNMSVFSADPDEDHHFLKLDIAHSASSFVPSETSQTSIPSGNVLPTTVGVHRYLIKARMKPFEIGQLSGNGSTAGQYLKSNGGTSAPSWESFDTTPTANSTKPVTSGGIKTALDGKQPNISITTNTSTPSDNDTVIMQASGTTNTTSFLRRTMSKIWEYIKSKAEQVYIPFGAFNMTREPNYFGWQDRLYDLQFDDCLYGAHVRFNIDAKIVDSNNTVLYELSDSQKQILFTQQDNAFSSNLWAEGSKLVIEITPLSGNSSLGIGNNGWWFFCFSYNCYPTGSMLCRIRTKLYSATAEQEYSEWIDAVAYSLKGGATVRGHLRYARTTSDATLFSVQIEIGGGANSSGNLLKLSEIIYISARQSGLGKLTKHAFQQRFYGNIESTKFIKTDGTSSQLLAANGDSVALPLAINKGGTGATTAIGAEYNILNQVADIDTNLTDTRKIALCNQTKSSSNGVFRWITLSRVWDWIKGKTDALYAHWNGAVNTPGCLRSQYQLFDWRLHDFFFALDKRVSTITWKTYDSETDEEVADHSSSISKLFDGNCNTYDTVYPAEGQYDVIYITSSTSFMTFSGKLYLGFYHRFVPEIDPVVRVKRGDNNAWVTLTPNKYLLTLTADISGNCYYLYTGSPEVTVTDIEITFHGRSDKAVYLSNICFFKYRSNTEQYSAVTKHAVTQNLYGEVVAPKFTMRGGTASQVLLANGTTLSLPVPVNKGGTGATGTKAARMNLLSNATVLTSGVSDNNLFVFRYLTPSNDNGAIYYREAPKVWNWIKSKADAVYSTIASLANYYTKTEVDTALDGKRNLFTLTNSWIGQNLAGTTYGVACRFKLTSVSESRTIYMRINARGVIHNLKILASSSSLAIGDRQAGTDANDDEVYGHLDTSTGIVTIYLKMRNYREGASVTEFNPAGYYYYNNRLTDVTFPNKESVDTLPEGYVTAVQDGWARYDRYGNDISTYYQPVLTAGTGLSISDNTINHSNSVTAQTSNLGSSVRIPAIKYDAQGHITYGTYYDVFSSDLYSVIKCGYINNSTSGVGWMKVGEVTYWTGTYQRYTVVISVMGNHSDTYNDFGILRIRLANSTTAGVASTPSAQWLVKTAGTSTRFKSDCIRMTKNETSSSSGVTLTIYMYVAASSGSYNFQVINEAIAGNQKKSHYLKFSNSTAKETTEPSPTYSSVMAPLELGNQSNCLVITNDNWQSYLTASNGNNNSFGNCDILTIPEGISSIFFSQSLIVGTTETMEANIALVRGAGSLGRFPRNGVRISIAGNWRPQSNGGYSGSVDGCFSSYIYQYRGGAEPYATSYKLNMAFEDFIYFNGVWYSKGY